MASSFLRFLDHTHRRNTVGRNPLDEWSALRRDPYLTTHNTYSRLPRPRQESQQANGRRRHGHWDLGGLFKIEICEYITIKSYASVVVYNPNIFWEWRERIALCLGQRADCPCQHRDLRLEKLGVADDHKHSCTSYSACSMWMYKAQLCTVRGERGCCQPEVWSRNFRKFQCHAK